MAKKVYGARTGDLIEEICVKLMVEEDVLVAGWPFENISLKNVHDMVSVSTRSVCIRSSRILSTHSSGISPVTSLLELSATITKGCASNAFHHRSRPREGQDLQDRSYLQYDGRPGAQVSSSRVQDGAQAS